MVREDPRLARSRAALLAAMTAALDSDEGVDHLTIADLTRRAGVSRPTFYQHFADPAALVRAAALGRLQATFDRIPDVVLGETWPRFVRGTLRTILADLHAHERFYLRTLHGPSGVGFLRDVVQFLAGRLHDVSPLGPVIRRRVDAATARARAEFLAAGAVWHVVRWLEGDASGEDAVDAAVGEVGDLLLTSSGATPEEIESARLEHDTEEVLR